MSTCPEKDIHSVYIDNELSPAYCDSYKAHLEECPECKKEYEKLNAIHQALQADSHACELSEAELGASYDRLMSRLSFSQVSGRKSHTSIFQFENVRKYAVGAAAAAFVILFAVPKQNQANSSVAQIESSSDFVPVARTSLVSPLYSSVQIDEPLTTAILASDQSISPTPLSLNPISAYSVSINGEQAMLPAIGQGNQYRINTSSSLASYDIFTQIPSEEISSAHQKAFSFTFTSPLASFSFEIGNGN